jgi:hypothetical protein
LEQHSPELVHGCPAARQPVVLTQRLMKSPPSGGVREQPVPPGWQNWQTPLQQSPLALHTSPSALQLAEKSQRNSAPPTNSQFREQQPPPERAGLQISPAERQFVAGPKGVDARWMFWQVVEHTFPQHSTSAVQVALIGLQS